jgi:four helix bundle protein
LLAYKKSYELAMKIFLVSKKFPAEEKFSLTDQIRRSSRSESTNLVEAYKRTRYKNYFINKLNDAEQKIAKRRSGLTSVKIVVILQQTNTQILYH